MNKNNIGTSKTELTRKCEIFNNLISFLSDRRLISSQVNLSERIGIHRTVITRNKKTDDARHNELNDLFDKISNEFGLTINYSDEGERFVIKESDEEIISDDAIADFVGIYEGYFIRSSENKICEITMSIMPNGKAFYKSERINSNKAVGKINMKHLEKKILWMEFFHDDYNVVYVFKANLFEDSSNVKLLNGIYGGFGKQTGFDPMNGLIVLKKGKVERNSYQSILDSFDSTSPRSYNIEKEEEMNILLSKDPGVLSFFFGNTFSPIHSETIRFFQRSKLLDRFEYDARGLAGNYLLYRINTKRNALVVRPMKIFPDGRVKMKLTRRGANEKDEYWGRVHTFNNCLAISIDRVISTAENRSILHRTHYIFDSNGSKHKETFDRLFGMSCIISSGNEIRVGDEILVKVDTDYQNNTSRIDTNIEKLIKQEKEIFLFLKRGIVSKVIKRPNSKIYRSSLYGDAFFESACYHAIRGDERKCIENLKLAFLHGYDDNRIVTEIQKGGLFYSYRSRIESEMSYHHGTVIDNRDIEGILYPE